MSVWFAQLTTESMTLWPTEGTKYKTRDDETIHVDNTKTYEKIIVFR